MKTPQDNNEEATNGNIQKRLNNLYSKQELPTHASISEVEAMKARISELEAKLLESTSHNIPSSPKKINSEIDSQYSNEIANLSIAKEKEQKKENFLTNLLRAPTFGDHSKNRIASLQHKILVGLTFTSILALIILLLTWSATSTATSSIIVATSIALYSVAFAWLYQGRLQLVSWLLVAIFYSVIVTTQLTGTFSQTTVLLVTIVIAIAGVLLKPFQVIAVTTLTIITSVFFAATNSDIPPAQTTIIFMGVLFGLEGLLLTFGAGAIEQSFGDIDDSTKALVRSNKQLQDLTQNLEQRVAERTHDLELAAEVGQSITQRVGNLSKLLSQSAELIRSKFSLYYTQIYIVDPSGRSLVLRAGTGTAGAELARRGHRLAVTSASLNGRAATTRKPVLVDDTQKSIGFLPNLLLPLTRSELAVPLIVNDKVVGVLDMQSEKPETFSEANLQAFQVLAGQLAIAIQNSVLFKEVGEARSVLEDQARRLTGSGWKQFLNAVDRNESIGYVFSQDEVLPLVETQSPVFEDTLTVPIEITGANVGEVQLADQAGRKWTTAETELVRATVARVGQHIENLRLLAQAERYRAEAEQVSRRLTREGWDSYLQTRGNLAAGYSYNLNEIKALDKTVENDTSVTRALPINVRDETIGELLVNADSLQSSEANEVFSAIAAQLGEHIENLRLLEETQQQRGQLSEALTIAKLANWEYDPEKDIFTFNDNFFQIFHTTAAQAGGYKLSSAQYASRFVHPDDRVVVGAEIEKALNSTDRTYDTTLEHRFLYTDGGTGYLSVSIHIERDEEGHITRYTGANQDVSERRNAQNIITQRANQLETVAAVSATASTVLNPDALLNAVVNLTKERFDLYHAHIYLFDESWNTLLLAAGAGEVGYQLVTAGHAIQIDAKQSLVARAARERQAVIVNDVHKEADFLSNPLLPNTRSEMAIPMIVGDKVLGVLDVQSEQVDHFTQEDVSIQTTLAAQVGIALQNARLYQEQSATVLQLRELDRLKSSFLANMSHELRTPLNSILGFADVMLEELDGPLTPYMDNDLKLIQKNGQHLLHLINDVLDMAKIESGKLNLIIETFNLHEIMEDVASITSSLATEKDISLRIDADSDHEVEISADRNRLRQVMINLVNNAMKFTEKGKIALHITREENNVLISVKDTGIGIHPSHLESVFQEFTQVDSSTTRKSGGTGLGLPISRKLIEMHGGRLWAESTGIEGEGTTFYVFLPIESQVESSEPVTRSA